MTLGSNPMAGGSAAVTALMQLEISEEALEASRSQCLALEVRLDETQRKLAKEEETTQRLRGRISRLEQFHSHLNSDMLKEISLYRRCNESESDSINADITNLVTIEHQESQWPAQVERLEMEVQKLEKERGHWMSRYKSYTSDSEAKTQEMIVEHHTTVKKLEKQLAGLNQALHESKSPQIMQRLKGWKKELFELREGLHCIRMSLFDFRRYLSSAFPIQLACHGVGMLGARIEEIRVDRTRTRKALNEIREQLASKLEGVPSLERWRHNLGRGDNVAVIISCIHHLKKLYTDNTTYSEHLRSSLLAYQMQAAAKAEAEASGVQTDVSFSPTQKSSWVGNVSWSREEGSVSPSESDFMNAGSGEAGLSPTSAARAASGGGKKRRTSKVLPPHRVLSGGPSLSPTKLAALRSPPSSEKAGEEKVSSTSKDASVDAAEQQRVLVQSRKTSTHPSGQWRLEHSHQAEGVGEGWEYEVLGDDGVFRPYVETQVQGVVGSDGLVERKASAAAEEVPVPKTGKKMRRRRRQGSTHHYGRQRFSSSGEPRPAPDGSVGHLLPAGVDEPSLRSFTRREERKVTRETDHVVLGSRLKYPLPFSLKRHRQSAFASPTRTISPTTTASGTAPSRRRVSIAPSPHPEKDHQEKDVDDAEQSRNVAVETPPLSEEEQRAVEAQRRAAAEWDQKGAEIEHLFSKRVIFSRWERKLAAQRRLHLVQMLEQRIDSVAHQQGVAIPSSVSTVAGDSGLRKRPLLQGKTAATPPAGSSHHHAAPKDHHQHSVGGKSPASRGLETPCCDTHANQAVSNVLRLVDGSQADHRTTSPRCRNVAPTHRPAPPKRYNASDMSARQYPDPAWIASRREEIESTAGTTTPSPHVRPAHATSGAATSRSSPHPAPLSARPAPSDSPMVKMTTARPSSARSKV